MFIRLITSYLVFFLLTLYFLQNISSSGEGVGQEFLLLMVTFYLLLFCSSKKVYSLKRVKLSIVMLLVFFTYFFINVLFDYQDVEELKKVSIGTNNGVLFSVVCGVISSTCISIIYRISSYRRKYLGFSLFFFILLLFFILNYSVDILQIKMSEVRNDIFLIMDNNSFYQRPAAFMFMMFMLHCSLFVMLAIVSVNTNQFRFFLFVPFFMIIILSLLLSLISQLIGSNSGLVTIVGFTLVWSTFLAIFITNKKTVLNLLNVKFLTVLFSSVGKTVIAYFLTVLVLVLSLFFSFINILGLQPEHFRLLGFGSGSNSSVDSRLELIVGNFSEHFSYNPIFGKSNVDVLTTGEGTYIHSLLSIITHQGLVGFLIFLCLMFFIYRDVALVGNGSYSIYNNQSYKLFRLFSLLTVLTFATFSAFFTWMPFWFFIGLLGLNLPDYRGELVSSNE